MALSTVVAAPGQTLTVLVVVVLVFVVGPLRRVQGFVVQFDCLTMLPEGRVVDDAQTMISPCPIAVNIGQNYVEGVKYAPGKTVPVELKVTSESVSGVFCRASQVLMATPLGSWIAKSPFLSPYGCLKADDALQSNDSKPISTGTILIALWTPPSTSGYGDMEIVCTFVANSNKYWIWNSFMLSEATN